MLKTGILLCLIGAAATSPLHAADIIEVEKMSKDQFRQALQAAPDDAAIEYQGQNKTKAEWRGYFQAQFKPVDKAKLKQLAEENKAKFEAAAKALQDEQDKRVTEENAQITKEFEEFNSH
jgi:hypothetical protein